LKPTRDSGYDGFATGSFDLSFGCSGELTRSDLNGAGDFTIAEHFYVGLILADDTSDTETDRVHFSDGLIELDEIANIQDSWFNPKAGLIEAADGETPIERHLTTFEADTDTAARAGGLAFATATGGLTVTSTFAAADTLFTVDRTFNIL
jgi:hypothetical protein